PPHRPSPRAGSAPAGPGDWTAALLVPDGDEARASFMPSILSSLVTRKVFLDGEVCEPQPALAAETVTIRQAMRMVSTSSAFAIGMESVVGSLEHGKLADFVIVSDDPLTIEPDSIHEMRVLATVIGGVA